MTHEQIITLVEQNIEPRGPQARAIAETTTAAAIQSVGRITEVPWNKTQTTFDLTAGTKTYTPDDLFTDIDNFRGISALAHTDVQGYPIVYKSVEEFSNIARGASGSGRPLIYTIYDKGNTLEFYPNPDIAYTIWCLVAEPLKFEEIPDEYNEIVLWKAILMAVKTDSFAAYRAKSLYDEIMAAILAYARTFWDGERVDVELPIGHFGKKSVPNTSNFYGLV